MVSNVGSFGGFFGVAPSGFGYGQPTAEQKRAMAWAWVRRSDAGDAVLQSRAAPLARPWWQTGSGIAAQPSSIWNYLTPTNIGITLVALLAIGGAAYYFLRDAAPAAAVARANPSGFSYKGEKFSFDFNIVDYVALTAIVGGIALTVAGFTTGGVTAVPGIPLIMAGLGYFGIKAAL